jgi:hypothetical protein
MSDRLFSPLSCVESLLPGRRSLGISPGISLGISLGIRITQRPPDQTATILGDGPPDRLLQIRNKTKSVNLVRLPEDAIRQRSGARRGAH